MIKGITLANFKRFKEETYFPLSRINLLTGINGKGKSTLIQSLLLLKQSTYLNSHTNKIILNDNFCSLGNLIDVKNESSQRSQNILIGFDLSDNKTQCYYNLYFNAEDSNDSELELMKVELETINEEKSTISTFDKINDSITVTENDSIIKFYENVEFNMDFFIPDDVTADKDKKIITDFIHERLIINLIGICHLIYISADRIGPRKEYTANNLFSSNNAIDPIGNNSTMFFQKRELNHLDNWKHDKSDNITTFISIIEYWYEQILGKTRVDVNKITSTIYELRFNNFLATNVGFGYSYILPILLSVVNAKEDEIIIIENPEAHLHPKAQHNLVKFLYFAAANHNINFIIETHSEHILNGFRVAMVNDDKTKLKGEDFSILYFTEDDKEIYKKIIIDDKGIIENWPNDFFDQNTKDINAIFGL